MDTYQKLVESTRALNRKYPEGTNPFQIVTRICEEAGEVAAESVDTSWEKLRKYLE